MAVSRKAMTEGIRTPSTPGTLDRCSFTIPQSKIRDFCQLPLHKGAVGCSRTSAFVDVSQKKKRIVPHSFFDSLKRSAVTGTALLFSLSQACGVHKGLDGRHRVAVPENFRILASGLIQKLPGVSFPQSIAGIVHQL